VALVSLTILATLFLLHDVTLGGDSFTFTRATIYTNEGYSTEIHTSNSTLPSNGPPTGEGEEIALPHSWDQHYDALSVAWYKTTFKLDSVPDSDWSLFIPSHVMTTGALVNDYKVGGDLSPAKPLKRFWNRPVLYSVPRSFLTQGENTVWIRLEAQNLWGRINQFHIGPAASIKPSYTRLNFLRVTYLNATASICLFLCIFTLAIGRISKEPLYFWFATFSFSMTLFVVHTLIQNIPLPNKLWDLGISYILGMMVACGSLFTFRYLDKKRPRVEKLLALFSIGGALLMLSLVFLGTEGNYYSINVIIWNGLVILFGLYPMAMMVRSVILQPSIQAFALAICYISIITLGVHDWLFTNGLAFHYNGMMTQFAIAPLVAAIGLVLMQRFITALSETEQLNQTLEKRIDEKSQKIEQVYKQIGEKERNEALVSERERIMRDMHDGVGSNLIGALSRLKREYPDDKELAEELTTALDDLRLMIDSLDEVENDLNVVLGLLRNRIQTRLESENISLTWRVSDLPPALSLGPQRTLHLLRIMQESITNIIKHAKADSITLTTAAPLKRHGKDYAFIFIQDNGIGIPKERPSGRGLTNMNYRADQAGFELVVTASELGTEVSIGVLIDSPSIPK